MGWTSYYIYGSPKAECDKMLNWEKEQRSCKVLKSCMKGNIYYAVVNCKNKETGYDVNTAAIFITSYSPKAKSFNFGYKDMDETCGPYYYDFPESYLNLLSPTDNQFALEWREKVRKNIERKKKLSSIKVGDMIKFKALSDMTSGVKAGEEVILKKTKRGFTHGSYWSWSKKNIPDDFEIINK